MEKNKIQKPIDVIGVMSDKGASCRGADLGPRAIRYAGLLDAIKQLGYTVEDRGDIRVESENPAESQGTRIKNIIALNEINTLVYKKVCETLERDAFPVVLGGDHSITTATATAVQWHYGKIGIIWIDAHGDFNDAQTSPSGNAHGTPLSAITGCGPAETLPFKERQAIFIKPKNAVIVGARSLDDAERVRLKEAGVTVFCMEDIEKDGIYDVMREAVRIASEGTEGIYLSFDLDALDPFYAPGVGTPVSGGLTYREALLLCEYMATSGRLLGIEVTEVNPVMDKENRTAQAAVQFIAKMLGKTTL